MRKDLRPVGHLQDLGAVTLRNACAIAASSSRPTTRGADHQETRSDDLSMRRRPSVTGSPLPNRSRANAQYPSFSGAIRVIHFRRFT